MGQNHPAGPEPRTRPAGAPGDPVTTVLRPDEGEDPLEERSPEPAAEESLRRGEEDGSVSARDESDRGEADPGAGI